MMRLQNVRPKPFRMILLTPFLDVLTVILIFLIVTYSPDEAQIETSNAVKLPKSSVVLKGVPDFRVEISTKEIKLNGEKVANADDWKGMIEALQKKKTERDESLKAKNIETKKEAKEGEKILVLADAKLTFQSLDAAFGHIAGAGFSDIYLLTELTKEEGQK